MKRGRVYKSRVNRRGQRGQRKLEDSSVIEVKRKDFQEEEKVFSVVKR